MPPFDICFIFVCLKFDSFNTQNREYLLESCQSKALLNRTSIRFETRAYGQYSKSFTDIRELLQKFRSFVIVLGGR